MGVTHFFLPPQAHMVISGGFSLYPGEVEQVIWGVVIRGVVTIGERTKGHQ